MTIVAAALRRPVPVSIAIGTVVLLLAAPALALKTGPFSVGQLPKDDPARQDAELIEESAGGGLEAPFVVVAATPSGTITDKGNLEALSRWQDRIAKTPGVQSVVGPQQVSEAVEPLQETGSAILASNKKVGPLANLTRLSKGMDRVASGVAAMRGGLSRAAAGAALLAEGSGQAEEGAIQIASGVGEFASGSQQALDAIGEVAKGNKELAKANESAAVGGLRIKFGSHDIVPEVSANLLPRAKKLQRSLDEVTGSAMPQLKGGVDSSNEKLNQALQQVEGMTTGKSDPNYDAALEALRQASAVSGPLPGETAALQETLDADADQAKLVKLYVESSLTHMRELAAAAKQLSDGLYKIQKGSKELAVGSAKLDREVSKEFGQVDEFQSATEQLAAGLTQLTGGTSELERRLSEFYVRSYPVQSGSRRIAVSVESQNKTINKRVNALRSTSPGIFESGYFVLSALDGSTGRLRERAGEAVDLEHGGQAATLLVIPEYTLNSPGSIDLNKKLDKDAAALGKETGLKTGVTGGPATLNTFSRVTRERIPVVIAAIILATFLVLVLVLRSIPLAALAIALNMASVGVAFGVLMLLTNVPDGWPLGGHTYVDAVSTVMIFGVVFGLSIDYAVFLLVRMREHYDRHGDNAAAIEFGLEKTARVITGAAVIMMAVFIAFASAPIATVSQIGIGLTVAVILDASVVRIVLLPALMLLIGDRVWWLPKALDRALPRLNV